MKNAKNKTVKTILMTFDYELFLNNSGTLENCILQPVDKLLEYSEKHRVKSTYFVDVLYYLRMIESGENINEARLVKDQLQRLVLAGNRIELHLHPQWLDAKRKDSTWEFTTLEHYRLHSLPQEKITDLFVTGTEILENIANEVCPGYKVLAFRAGGWCIQPFDKLKEGFIKSGIKVDSTVMPGLRSSGSNHEYDFMSAPDLPFYKFTNDPGVSEEKGLFYEVPITSFTRSTASKITGKIVKYLNKKEFTISGDGSGLPSGESTIKRLKSAQVACTLDDVVPSQFAATIKHIDKPLITVMSHPKLLSKSSLEAMKKLIGEDHEFAAIDSVIDDHEKGCRVEQDYLESNIS